MHPLILPWPITHCARRQTALEHLLVHHGVAGFASTFATAMFSGPVFRRHLVQAVDVFQLVVDPCRDVVFHSWRANESLLHPNSLTSPGFLYYLSWSFRHIVHGLCRPSPPATRQSGALSGGGRIGSIGQQLFRSKVYVLAAAAVRNPASPQPQESQNLLRRGTRATPMIQSNPNLLPCSL